MSSMSTTTSQATIRVIEWIEPRSRRVQLTASVPCPREGCAAQIPVDHTAVTMAGGWVSDQVTCPECRSATQVWAQAPARWDD